jgi:hypothetical protein
MQNFYKIRPKLPYIIIKNEIIPYISIKDIIKNGDLYAFKLLHDWHVEHNTFNIIKWYFRQIVKEDRLNFLKYIYSIHKGKVQKVFKRLPIVAAKYGKFKIFIYLQSVMKNIHYGKALINATEGNHLQLIKHLCKYTNKTDYAFLLAFENRYVPSVSILYDNNHDFCSLIMSIFERINDNGFSMIKCLYQLGYKKEICYGIYLSAKYNKPKILDYFIDMNLKNKSEEKKIEKLKRIINKTYHNFVICDKDIHNIIHYNIYKNKRLRQFALGYCFEKNMTEFLDYTKNKTNDIKLDKYVVDCLFKTDESRFMRNIYWIYNNIKKEYINGILSRLAKQKKINIIFYILHNHSEFVNVNEAIECMKELDKYQDIEKNIAKQIIDFVVYLYEDDLRKYYNQKEEPYFLGNILSRRLALSLC